MHHQRDDANPILHPLKQQQQQRPPMPQPAMPGPYLVPPDVDNELLSLFMVASGEEEPGFQWAPGAAVTVQPPMPATVKSSCAMRLARKAELARASRLRKKQYIGDLEQRVRQLKEAVGDAQDRVRRASNALRIPSAAGPQRRSSQYLDLAQERLGPSVPVKFAIWTLDQPDDFYGQPGLWQSLVQGEIGLGPSQVEALRARQRPIRALRQTMAQVKQAGDRIRAECHRVQELIAAESLQFQQMLSPAQVDALQRWVASHDPVVDVSATASVR